MARTTPHVYDKDKTKAAPRPRHDTNFVNTVEYVCCGQCTDDRPTYGTCMVGAAAEDPWVASGADPWTAATARAGDDERDTVELSSDLGSFSLAGSSPEKETAPEEMRHK